MSDLKPELEAFRVRICEALPSISVSPHPYDIGYWSYRAKLEPPSGISESMFLVEFEAGRQQAAMEDQ